MTIIKNYKLLLDTSNISEKDLPVIGGKARQLFELEKLGFNIPKWMVLSSPLLEQIFEKNDQKLRDLISLQLGKRFGENCSFAVRSSALQEDGEKHSFAGQFETVLNVKHAEIWEAITKVYQSAQSERVKQYCQKNDLEHLPDMAILIQEMVQPDVSGVAFGINPTNGHRYEKVISAVYGLGEALVSGELNADTYVVGSQIESTIAKKTQARKSISKGTTLTPVPIELQEKACLSKQQLLEICDILDDLKINFGKAQDIEFAYVQDQLYLLQTRPITGLNKLADQQGQYLLWDNSNIVESYPGVTSPLTYSFIKKVYNAAYRQVSILLGVSTQQIENNRNIFTNLLGLLKGRVYYNLPNWYRMLALLPGFRLNARFMENMMGVKERFDLPAQKQSSKISAWYRLILAVIKMLWQLIRLPKASRQFHQLVDRTINKYRKINFDRSRPEELMEHYLNFENLLLKQWKAPLVNDLFAMIFFGLLQKTCAKFFPEKPNLHNALVSGSGNIISAQPAKKLLSITALIREDAQCKTLFERASKEEIWDHLKSGHFPAVKNKIDAYILKFGDRCTGELKLETITYRQKPTDLIHILQSYVQQSLSEKKEPTVDIKQEAEAYVFEALKGKWLKRKLFQFLLKKARALVSGRENLRFERTRAFAIVREIFCEIGRNWHSEGILDQPRDIFFLTQQEIFDYIKGTSVNDPLKDLVELRKSTFQKFKSENTPSERIATYGMVYHGNDFYQTSDKAITQGDISGIGCCPGVIKGKIQIVHHPNEIDSLEGDILVTTSTDPGWVALFPTASAILVERGSILSHSAIVAREMGIPCIVGIRDLLKRVNTGEVVEMDGSTGVVKKINPNHAS